MRVRSLPPLPLKTAGNRTILAPTGPRPAHRRVHPGMGGLVSRFGGPSEASAGRHRRCRSVGVRGWSASRRADPRRLSLRDL